VLAFKVHAIYKNPLKFHKSKRLLKKNRDFNKSEKSRVAGGPKTCPASAADWSFYSTNKIGIQALFAVLRSLH
jgi:hypothetical protein